MATPKKPPSHGVGGGVVSAKPAARGGRSSELHTPYIGAHAASDPLDNPRLKAVTKPPGVTVTTPRRSSSGGGRSDYTPHPGGQSEKVPFTHPKSELGQSRLAAYLKQFAAREAKRRVAVQGTAKGDAAYGYDARYDSNSPKFKGSATAKPGRRVK